MDETRIANNLRLLARSDLGGSPNGGEGMAIKITKDGERYLFIAHENPPTGLSVLKITDPRDPKLVFQQPTPTSSVRTNSLALHGDLLLLANQAKNPGETPAGVVIYDVSSPSSPSQIAFFDTSGPYSRGTHFVSTMDGEFAHLSTGYKDFEPGNPKDDQFYMIVDIRDPVNPEEIGRWWLPGQRKSDDKVLVRHTESIFDMGFRVHHALSYPQRPDRAYLGYIDGGIVILDLSNMSQPSLVTRYDYHPPMNGFTHTVVPLFDRELLVVTDEASGRYGDDGYDWPKRIWIVDAREDTNLVTLCSAPNPEGFSELHRIGGRIGAHNIHENEPIPGMARLQNTVVATWFSAGVRIYDIRDRFQPKEIAAFLPTTPDDQRGCRINDVLVEDRGIIYALDRVKGGLYVLDYTGDQPLD